jgi:polar amino acid transport system substrate-binding protein
MVTITIRRAVIMAVFLALAAPAVAQSLPELEYAYPDQSVWTTKVDAAGDPENPLLRLAGALFSRAGIPWYGKSYPAGRMFEILRGGRAKFSMLVSAPALKDCCLSSKKPVASTELRVYRAAGTPAVHSRDDLLGKNVILIRGYSYAGLRDFVTDERNGITSHMAATHEAAFAMLAHKRSDYVLDYVGPASEVLAANPGMDNVRSDTMSRLEVYLVLSKAYPDAEAVMAKLEAIAEGLDRDAVLKGAAK